MSVIDDLLGRGLIESVGPDLDMAQRWLEDASRHLTAADAVVDIDPSGAYVLAYDAARKALAAVLLRRGHRILSRPGAHRALAEFGDYLAESTGQPELKRFDRLRRNRNRAEYGSISFNKTEVEEALSTATAIYTTCLNLQ